MVMRWGASNNNKRRDATYPGRNGGTIEIYTGAPPTQVGDAITSQILLLTFQLGNPAGSSAGNGEFKANAIADAVAVATGVAQWYRQLSLPGVIERDGVVGINATDDIQIADVAITIGQSIAFVQWLETESNMYTAPPLI